MKSTESHPISREFRAELLKERIYATLALLAVLITIDPGHATAITAGIMIAGTALSLWAASLVAGQMSYRIVMQEIQPEHKFRKQLARHSPLLLAAAFPLLTVAMAYSGFISLTTAINMSVIASMLLLLSWSMLSARALKARGLTVIIIAGVELLIGLAIVGLKMWVSH